MIRFISKGLDTSIQDRGRFGYKRFGITTSGAMDEVSMRIVNRIVGNWEFEGVIEFTLFGPTIEFEKDSIIAVGGGDVEIKIDERVFPMWKALYVRRGSVLSFGEMKRGMRGYIAIQGGLSVDKILGSLSFDRKGKMGFDLKNGVRVKTGGIRDKSVVGRELKKECIPKFDGDIGVLKGPDLKNFTEESFNALFHTDWMIDERSDRMGIRLKGGRIKHSDRGANIESQGILEGTIQVPEDGKPIVLMKEHPTTGGYARIGVVIKSHIYKLSQRRFGEKIRFKEFNLKDAIVSLKDREKFVRSIKFKKVKRFIMVVNEERYSVEVEEDEDF